MKQVLFVACIALISIAAHNVVAQNNSNDSELFTIVRSTERELVVRVKPQIVSSPCDTVLINGQRFLRPLIRSAVALPARQGAPLSWAISTPIGVPSEKGFVLRSVSVGSVKKLSLPPLPMPYIQTDSSGLPTEIYTPIEQEYRRFIPSDWVSLQYVGIARGQHVASLQIMLAQGNDGATALLMPEEILVHIEFTPPTRKAILPKSLQYDRKFTLNSDIAKQWLVGTTPAKSSVDLSSFVKDAPALKIGVTEEGVYRLTAQQLTAAGIPTTPSAATTMKLFGSGGRELAEGVLSASSNAPKEQPIVVRTNSDGSIESIVFYGAPAHGFAAENGTFRHYINHYSQENYYVLTISEGAGKRAIPVVPPTEAAQVMPISYTERIFQEQDIVNPYTPGSGRRWFGRSIERSFPATLTTTLHNIDKTGQVFYRIAAAHKTGQGATATMQFSESGTPILSLTLTDTQHAYTNAYAAEATAQISASAIQGDRSILQAEYRSNAPVASASGLLDWYEIHYPRPFVPINNSIGFFSDNHSGIVEYSINGFTPGTTIYGFDVTNPAEPRLLQNLASTGGLFVLKASVQSATPSRFFVSSTERTPASLTPFTITGIRSIPAQTAMLVITAKELLSSAKEYAEYRSSISGFAVQVITVEDIYAEFNAGLPDPTAIRDFVASAYNATNRGIKYVLFWGDGHYDFRNISTEQKNYIPTYQSYDDGFFDASNKSYATDEYFLCVEGDDTSVDIAFGRLAVRSNNEGRIVLDKIRRYETPSDNTMWRSRVLLVADDSPTNDKGRDGTLHTRPSDSLFVSLVPPSFIKRNIYLPDYPLANIPGGRRKPRAAQDLVEEVNRGYVVLNWIGHGNPRVWAHEEIFDKDITIQKFRNKERPFFLTAATCDFARYDDPDRQSGAEEMISHPDGGAIGVFSASRIVFAQLNEPLLFQFYTEMFKRNADGSYPTFGEILFACKQYRNYSQAIILNNRKFTLLGDPVLKPAFPQQEARITSINNTNVESSISEPIAVQGLSKVRVEGIIRRLADTVIDDTFQGNVLVSLYDAFVRKSVRDDDGTIHVYSDNGGLLGVGTANVVNGRFTAEFMIPKNISFSEDKALIQVFANSSQNPQNVAHGSFTNIVVAGIGNTGTADTIGPTITIYFDDRRFRSGDLVSQNPLLLADISDESGINASGSGIGQNIEAWIDQNPFSINLTPFFAVSPEDFRQGTVERTLSDLTPGLHTIKVRAWDVFNNMSEQETSFRVGENGRIEAGTVTVYPNPSTDIVNITFRHTAEIGSNVSAKIYSLTGREIADLGSFTADRVLNFQWNGIGDDGQAVFTGVYLCNVVITDRFGKSVAVTAKIMIIR